MKSPAVEAEVVEVDLEEAAEVAGPEDPVQEDVGAGVEGPEVDVEVEEVVGALVEVSLTLGFFS